MAAAAVITRVLVTGFGPFGNVVNNPSWGIASRLPSTLPGGIELLVHPSEIPVAYHSTFDLFPGLYTENEPDIVLHIGVAEGREYFAVEQSSSATYNLNWGYQSARDVEGEVFTVAEQESAWANQPIHLETDLDLLAVVAAWQNRTSDIVYPAVDSADTITTRTAESNKRQIASAGSPVSVQLKNDFTLNVFDQADVRWSDSVGMYLCAFIYYMGLIETGRVGSRDVTFLHVPLLESEAEIQTGVDVTIELIHSLVETWRPS